MIGPVTEVRLAEYLEIKIQKVLAHSVLEICTLILQEVWDASFTWSGFWVFFAEIRGFGPRFFRERWVSNFALRWMGVLAWGGSPVCETDHP